jgi:hypothetical protein
MGEHKVPAQSKRLTARTSDDFLHMATTYLCLRRSGQPIIHCHFLPADPLVFVFITYALACFYTPILISTFKSQNSSFIHSV